MPLAETITALAEETDFAGVVQVDGDGGIEFAGAFGLAHKGRQVANTMDTRFAIASGTKGLTALTIVSLIEEGVLTLETTARSVLGEDLPLIDAGVTVEHLLGHVSGIGDYLDEENESEITDYTLLAPPQELADTEQYVRILDGFPQKFPPGERFSYCNSGFVVLALIAERLSGKPFHTLVRDRVTVPAGMRDTEFLRSDEPAGRTALGYVRIDGSWRTNVFHLPVRGTGDGGIYTTVADFSAFWRALFAGEIVASTWVSRMTRPHSDGMDDFRYGLGFWLPKDQETVMLEGYDAGVSFRSVHNLQTKRTHTVISNSSPGAWPITRKLTELLDQR
jgi:CubicO group peptidase (beta-lactamase class C family)